MKAVQATRQELVPIIEQQQQRAAILKIEADKLQVNVVKLCCAVLCCSTVLLCCCTALWLRIAAACVQPDLPLAPSVTLFVHQSCQQSHMVYRVPQSP